MKKEGCVQLGHILFPLDALAVRPLHLAPGRLEGNPALPIAGIFLLPIRFRVPTDYRAIGMQEVETYWEHEVELGLFLK